MESRKGQVEYARACFCCHIADVTVILSLSVTKRDLGSQLADPLVGRFFVCFFLLQNINLHKDACIAAITIESIHYLEKLQVLLVLALRRCVYLVDFLRNSEFCY